MRLVLASRSPRRQALLSAVGRTPVCHPVCVDETPRPRETPPVLAERLARAKADAAAAQLGPDDVIVAADTVVALAGEIFGKPESAQQARQMLQRLAGARHTVTTGFCVSMGNARRTGVVSTEVRLRPLSAHEIATYVEQGESLDKAGGYGIQSAGGALVDTVRGSYSNVVGLPVKEVLEAIDGLLSEAIAQRREAVLQRVAEACRAAGRRADEVTLIAVSKRQPLFAILAAYRAGQRDFGESYAQELADKQTKLASSCPDIRWHFIGRVQTNKAAQIASAHLVHGVSSLKQLQALARRAQRPPIRALLQVNLAGEETKNGFESDVLAKEIKVLTKVEGARIEGLMTLPPRAHDPRDFFERLSALRDRLAGGAGARLPVLSMGMSDDFEAAIACGATHIRVGTAIFGARAEPGTQGRGTSAKASRDEQD